MKCIVTFLLMLMCLPLCATAEGVDLSTPKTAARSLYEAMLRGDAAALRQVIFVEKPEQAPLADAVADLLVAGKELGDAGKARFGDSAERLGAGTVIADDLVQIEQAQVSEKAGVASIVIPNQLAPLRFKKDEAGWKLLIDDYFAVHPDSAKQALLLKEFASSLRMIARELAAGRYPTVADAEAIIQQEFNEVMIRASRASTQPSTQPK